MLALRADGRTRTYDSLHLGDGSVMPGGAEMIRMFVKHQLEHEARILEPLGPALPPPQLRPPFPS